MGEEDDMAAPSRNHSSVVVDLAEIVDWPSFHAVFKEKMGFPDFYGANMSAWVDCMTCVDAPEDGMSSVHAPRDGVLVLALESVAGFKKRCPEIFEVLVSSAAFVNWRRLETDAPPVLMLSFYES
jgi:RNAse (barnase) inhibitor barstar